MITATLRQLIDTYIWVHIQKNYTPLLYYNKRHPTGYIKQDLVHIIKDNVECNYQLFIEDTMIVAAIFIVTR